MRGGSAAGGNDGLTPERGLGARIARFAPHGLLVVMLLLGGGGSPSPLPEMLLELAALLVVVATAWLARSGRLPRPGTALAFAAVALAVPVLQLVPLPPQLWQALPGREVEIAALATIGHDATWMPLAMSPPRTLAALLSLIPPLVVLVLTASADRRGRGALIAVVAMVALLSALIGAAQVAGGEASPLRFYSLSHRGYLTGFHANRNATADALLIGLVALGAVFAGRGASAPPRLLALAGGAILVGAVVLTGSRAGILLLLPTILVLAWFAWQGRATRVPRATLAGFVAVALAALAWVGTSSQVVRSIAARFAATNDPRPELWTDALQATANHWPTGVGLGGFVPAFLAAERLEAVDPSYPNRAHNDYLELAVEAGLPGLIVLATLSGVLVWRLWRRWRAAAPPERAELMFAGSTLFILAAHSSVDYPLRSMALAGVAGVAAGIILVPERQRRGMGPPGRVESEKA